MLGLHKANFKNKSFNRCIKILRSRDMFSKDILGIGKILKNYYNDNRFLELDINSDFPV